jgi:hypothetical protein
MFLRTHLKIVAAVLVAIAVAPAARAADGDYKTLDEACKDLAVQIDKALTAEKLTGSIVVQSFTNGTSFPNVNITRLLASALEAKNYKVKDNAGAPVFVKGTLFVSKTALVIETDLHKASEGRFQSWKHRVDNIEAAAQGATFDIKSNPPKQAADGSAPVTPKEKVAAAVQQDAVKPTAQLTADAKVCRPTAASPFGVSVIGRDGNPLPIKTVEGVAIVELAMDQEFTLRVINDTKADIGAGVSLDGINMFNFSENPDYKALGKIWVAAGGGRIDGWYHNDTKSRRFQMGKYDESVAAQQGVTEGVGGITVQFFGDPTPAGGSRGLVPDAGIKQGSEVASEYTPQTGKFGPLVAAVTIRYQKSDHPTDLPK